MCIIFCMYHCQIPRVLCKFKQTIIQVYKYQHVINSGFSFFDLQVLFEFSLHINTVNY